ncbi:MAG TPA: T9SS type A sorting domain-containing protein [Clostridiales bacterium]|nr:T9SS type A sorting domain-containing protein [Clostridiales bacterium]
MRGIKYVIIPAVLILCGILIPETAQRENGGGFSDSGKLLMLQNRVHKAGMLWINMTNKGYFGNPDGIDDPCTGDDAVSGEFPGGSGISYLFAGGLMLGGYLDSASVNIGGTDATVFQGPLVTTAYEGWTGVAGPDDMPKECSPTAFEYDPDGTVLGNITETSNVPGRMNCLFEEVYDPSASAEEQFNINYTDKYVARIYTGIDDYDKREHIPLGIEVSQKSYAWSYDYAKKFVITDYTIYNRNADNKDIYDFFMGLYMDCDIGITSGTWTFCHSDDICGFVENWNDYIDPATGEIKTVELNAAWVADNDGRGYTGSVWYSATGEPAAGAPLDGGTGVAMVKVLRTPNPDMQFSYNVYIANSDDESMDWGPRWQTGLHSEWEYDLSVKQKGYDDTNYDSLTVSSNYGTDPLSGGRTEGRPIGDRGKYMVMTNGEFDYGFTAVREVYLGMDTHYDGTPIPQADKWQRWTTAAEAGQPGFGEIPDGTIEVLNDIANGADVRYMLSFGPLGSERTGNVAADSDLDGVPDTVVANKPVWKFAHGDSLKLTVAFIVSEDFHTSTDQDPNYFDDTVVDLDDGLNATLYEQGWYDALNNLAWVQKIYDLPMYDTPVTYNGVTKSDGWYGEDVGADGLFWGDPAGGTCWWTDSYYSGPDEGEGDMELTEFSSALTDIYGHSASSEDELLPFGRETAGGIYGTTAEYGYMMKDPVTGTFVRYGYNNGKLDQGDGVPDFSCPPPPPSPVINAYYDGNDVVIEWQSHELYDLPGGMKSYSGPEHFTDPFSRMNDFESYTVKVSPNSDYTNFIDLVTLDRVDYIYQNVADISEFYDVPVETGNPDTLDQIITADGKIWMLIPYGNNRSLLENYAKEGIFEYTAVPDSAEYNGDMLSIFRYRLKLLNKYLANISYAAVLSSDFGYPKYGIPASSSSVAANMKKIAPEPEGEVVPYTTELFQNYPNPFNPETSIMFTLEKDCRAEIELYNVAGQKVMTVLEKDLRAGFHSVRLKAENLNSGVYFYKLITPGKEMSKKMLMVK